MKAPYHQSPRPNTLTTKQERFVEEYLVDFNATQAAIRAGYSKRTARSVGAENLTKPDIAAALEKARAAMAERANLSAGQVLERLEGLYGYAAEMMIEEGDDGNQLRIMRNAGLALKVLETQGKYLGMWNGEGAGHAADQDEDGKSNPGLDAICDKFGEYSAKIGGNGLAPAARKNGATKH